MKHLNSLALLAAPCLFATSCAVTSAPRQDARAETSRIELVYGERDADSDFDPVDEQDVYGLVYSSHRSGELAGWEIGYLHAEDDAEEGGVDVDVEIDELFVGGRYTFDVGHGPVHPYIGGGLAYLDGEIEISGFGLSDSEDDEDIGFYAHAGAYVNVGRSFTVGLDFRFLFDAEFEVDGESIDGDYEQLVLTVGFGF